MRELVKIFKSLSDTNRLRILKMLEVKPLCVCEITAVLNLATSTVSKHLAILRDVDLIIDEKDGKWVNYRLNLGEYQIYVNELLHLLTKWIPNDSIVQKDRQKVFEVDRHELCGL
jgi:ArsR family transcriptional regulator